jgi:pimeloyl-ACP methyl ester carboxylesterase/predicted glycosyltransferase
MDHATSSGPAGTFASESAGAGSREQTRARDPDAVGFVERGGVRVYWESCGEGEPAILFLPTWSIVHSRCWKAQIPDFARRSRVLTFDPRGNGKSDRPAADEAYAEEEFMRDALAVLDANGVKQAFIVSLSRGAQRALLLAAEHPERVLGAVFIDPFFPVSLLRSLHWRVISHPRMLPMMMRRPLTTRGFGKFNAQHWRADFKDFLEWWQAKNFTEPHSTKQVEDGVAWGLQTDPETAIAFSRGGLLMPSDRKSQLALARRVRCPVLVIHGSEDDVFPDSDSRTLARVTGGKLVIVEEAGHQPQARKPVVVNLALREFFASAQPAPTGAATSPAQPTKRRSPDTKRVLYISSPIGLGHAQRDVAVARELRKLVPGVEIDWLAQDPVTRVLAAEGERIHPGSRHLASESAHIESESSEHDLHCFQALRRMDEILIANFMVFHDVVREDRYDLWIADESWELDYYLHENPKEKIVPFAWFTDFVGWLPMDDGGARESALTADYNAQMVEHIAENPSVRDRALFVGNAEDIVPDRLGPQLPLIRDWTRKHFEFPGYISGFDPRELPAREALRQELGYRDGELICIVTVGGSGVGGALLRKVICAYPESKRRVPALRMIVVAGPRIDPASLPQHPDLEIVPYVHKLYRHLAACDLAIVQGGLTTAMELTANKRPFLYFPLRHHFEQNFHVRHRLDRYRAGRCMDFSLATPDTIADAIASEIGRTVDYRDVETDGARRAAARIAEML